MTRAPAELASDAPTPSPFATLAVAVVWLLASVFEVSIPPLWAMFRHALVFEGYRLVAAFAVLLVLAPGLERRHGHWFVPSALFLAGLASARVFELVTDDTRELTGSFGALSVLVGAHSAGPIRELLVGRLRAEQARVGWALIGFLGLVVFNAERVELGKLGELAACTGGLALGAFGVLWLESCFYPVARARSGQLVVSGVGTFPSEAHDPAPTVALADKSHAEATVTPISGPAAQPGAWDDDAIRTHLASNSLESLLLANKQNAANLIVLYRRLRELSPGHAVASPWLVAIAQAAYDVRDFLVTVEATARLLEQERDSWVLVPALSLAARAQRQAGHEGLALETLAAVDALRVQPRHVAAKSMPRPPSDVPTPAPLPLAAPPAPAPTVDPPLADRVESRASVVARQVKVPARRDAFPGRKVLIRSCAATGLAGVAFMAFALAAPVRMRVMMHQTFVGDTSSPLLLHRPSAVMLERNLRLRRLVRSSVAGEATMLEVTLLTTEGKVTVLEKTEDGEPTRVRYALQSASLHRTGRPLESCKKAVLEKTAGKPLADSPQHCPADILAALDGVLLDALGDILPGSMFSVSGSPRTGEAWPADPWLLSAALDHAAGEADVEGAKGQLAWRSNVPCGTRSCRALVWEASAELVGTESSPHGSIDIQSMNYDGIDAAQQSRARSRVTRITSPASDQKPMRESVVHDWHELTAPDEYVSFPIPELRGVAL